MKTRITSISFAGYGHQKVTIMYRNGKEYSSVTNMVYLTDHYKRETFTRKDEAIQKRAEKALIHFVKKSNNLR